MAAETPIDAPEIATLLDEDIEAIRSRLETMAERRNDLIRYPDGTYVLD